MKEYVMPIRPRAGSDAVKTRLGRVERRVEGVVRGVEKQDVKTRLGRVERMMMMMTIYYIMREWLKPD